MTKTKNGYLLASNVKVSTREGEVSFPICEIVGLSDFIAHDPGFAEKLRKFFEECTDSAPIFVEVIG